jgi:DNA-binding NarL/FixJ family response regulator
VRFVAAPPDSAVGALLLRRQAELTEARAALDALIAVYRNGRSRGIEEILEIITGRDALAERVVQLQNSAKFEQDRTILSLMLAGVTDDTVARQLGVSTRTVQRRVSELMTAAGARTRMQLGWHAATHQWLPAPAEPSVS